MINKKKARVILAVIADILAVIEFVVGIYLLFFK